MQPQSKAVPAIDTPPENALARYTHLYAQDLRAVDQLIIDLAAQSSAPLIGQMAQYIVHSGGKRLRPILTILSAKLFGYEGERHIRLAAAIEFIHTATLLHDDVVDESDLRRGLETANNRFGNAASVLVGDFLLSRAFQLMAQDGNLAILRSLSDASAIISEGEVKQLAATGDIATDEAAYLDIIGSKTAALFRAACEVGALIAERSEKEIVAMRHYGQQLGIAFQIIDDVLDYSASEAALGKTIGDDFREGKVTLPVILAHTAGNDEERAFWARVMEQPETQSLQDFSHAQALLQRHNVLKACHQKAEFYVDMGLSYLKATPDNTIRTALTELLRFSLQRKF